MRPSPEGGEDMAHPGLERGAAGGERQWIKIALQHQTSIECFRGPTWIDGTVKSKRIDAGACREIHEMVACPFRKPDHARVLMAEPEAGDDCLDRH